MLLVDQYHSSSHELLFPLNRSALNATLYSSNELLIVVRSVSSTSGPAKVVFKKARQSTRKLAKFH